MKIGTKLAICFVALAVLPLGAASYVYLRATAQFGAEMTERGKNLLSERVSRDLRRARELGAVGIEQTRAQVAEEIRFLASDVASRLYETGNEATPQTAPEADAQSGFILAPDAPRSEDDAARPIDLQAMSVHVAADASRDPVAGTLNRLAGLNQVARTVYLRNRGIIDTLTITFESGLTISYPGNAASVAGDPRESDWYLQTLERSQAAWFDGTGGKPAHIFVTAPVQLSDGRLAGTARASVRLGAMLSRALDATRLPPEADAFLLSVPKDDPSLMPYVTAELGAGGEGWQVQERPQPISLDGDDAWLKVVSDIRSAVPGLEHVTLDGKREVWAFGPVGATSETLYHIAVAFPSAIIDEAQIRVEDTVRASYRAQLQRAIIFAAVAGALAAGLAVFGAKTLTSPIRRLHEAASRLGRGDFSVRVEKTGGDEIGDLGRDFNRMVPALEEQIRVKRDLNTAQEIQQHLVPKEPPSISGFDIAGRTIYCDETGGDYQDYVPLGGARYAAIIGDVTGHGVAAALLMASARAVLRASAAHETKPAALLGTVNRQLSADSSGGRSLTLFYMQLCENRRDFDWISAGHEPALLFDPGNDTFTMLDGEDIPLGVDGEWTFSGRSATLPDGGLLVAYTDGIREAVNDAGAEYGLERLKTVIRAEYKRGSAAVLDAILADVETFRGKTQAKDDLSVLVVKPA